MADEPTSTRDEHGRWRKGYTPNPKGRPAGSRHKTTLAIEALLEGEAEALTRKAIDMAMNGMWLRCVCALNVRHHCARVGRLLLIFRR